MCLGLAGLQLGKLGFGDEAADDFLFLRGGRSARGGLVLLKRGDGIVVATQAVQGSPDVDLQARVGHAGIGGLEDGQSFGVLAGLGELAGAV